MKNKKYTPFFCEENIWHLCDKLKRDSIGNFFVLFLTNFDRTIALANQKAAKENNFIIWDYHVILHDRRNSLIYDFDSNLGFKTNAQQYFAHTFGNQHAIPENYRTGIMTIPAKYFVEHFSSDRSHMLGENEEELHPFPAWPKIYKKNGLSLKALMSLESNLIKEYGLQTTTEYLS